MGEVALMVPNGHMRVHKMGHSFLKDFWGIQWYCMTVTAYDLA